jgi:hypothetical protein
MDEMLEELIKIKFNYYIGKADLLEQPFLYTLSLPRTFLFTESGNKQGAISYVKPTVISTVDSLPISVTVVDDNLLQTIDKTQVVPTRIDANLLFSDFNNTVVAQTNIVNLSTSTINDNYVSELGHIYIEIDDATAFGEVLDNGLVITPKVIVKGIPWIEDVKQEEHMLFRVNGERKSRERWNEINSIETHGIYDGSTTIKVHTGFDKRSIKENLAFWESDIEETLLLYNLHNNTFNSNHLPTIQYLVPEITVPTLRQQGYGDDVLEYEFGVMLDSSNYLTEPAVGLERMPFTRWFLLATANSLYVLSARIPHAFNWITEDINGSNIISDGIKSRTVGAELIITADKNWSNYSEDGPSLIVDTKHNKPVRGIRSTRLSITYDSPGLPEVTTIYYDWNGNQINILVDPNSGWIYNSVSNASVGDWQEKHITIDVGNILTHPAWVAVVKLETIMSDSTEECDVFIVHSDVRTVSASFAWPDAIKGKVNGIHYDAKNRLLARTVDNEVWIINTYWDYCLVDYRLGTILLKEEYDNVEVTS